MVSLDANLLLYSYSERSPHHEGAWRFVEGLSSRQDVAVSEFVLAELYLLLRNPAVLDRPLSPADAVGVIERYREHPRWKTLGFPPDSAALHNELWHRAAEPRFARRRVYDARTALSLRAFGVNEFATANEKDFQGFGFTKVWNPLSA